MDTFFYVFIIAILIIILGVITYRFFKTHRLVWPRKTEPSPPQFRVLIALRRKSASLGQLLRMQEETHNEVIRHVVAQWQGLCQEWSQYGMFYHVFRKTDQGLPSGGDEDWFLISYLDIPDYSIYRQCIAVLEKPAYRDLRNFCDVRLVMGDVPTFGDVNISSFF